MPEAIDIYVNNKAAKANAFFASSLVSVLLLGALWVVASQRLEWDGLFGIFFGIPVFAWLFGYLIGSCLSLFKVARFEGVLMKIQPDGITDYWEATPQKLQWRDIEFIQLESYQLTKSLRLKPRHLPTLQRLAKLMGSMRLRYPTQYLSVSEASLSEFILKHAPPEVLK